jgi:hypothetical protein
MYTPPFLYFILLFHHDTNYVTSRLHLIAYQKENFLLPYLPTPRLELATQFQGFCRSKRILANLTQFIMRVETELVYHDIYATLLGVPPARI